MKAAVLFPSLPKHIGDYRFAWVFSFLLAFVSAPIVVYFRQSAPWLIAVPLGLGALVILSYEWVASQRREEVESQDTLVSLPMDFAGLKSYENLLALEIKPRKKEARGQLTLFPGFAETTPANAVRAFYDEVGKQIDVINCDRYSALLVSYLLDHLDEATEKSLAAGLARFGSLGKERSDIQLFVQDKGIREAIKSDFRGNLVSLVTRGGEKVVRDLVKAIEAKKAEVAKSILENQKAQSSR